MRIRTSLLVAAAFATLSFSAQAQTKWDMPTPYSDGEFHTRNVRRFAEDVKKATGGQLDLNVHSNGSLIKHPDMLRAVSTGQVNIAEFLLGQFGNEEPVFNADNVPFLAAGYDNAWKLYQAQKPILEKKLQGRGLVLLYSVAWPGQGLYTKNPLKSVDDFKGTKFRTYSAYTARLAELLGASPAVIQVPEVPQAFATGTISAMHPKNVVVVNARVFNGLTGAQKKVLTDAAAAAEKRGWDLSRAREQSANKMLADNGMTVHTPDAALMAAMNKVGSTIAAE